MEFKEVLRRVFDACDSIGVTGNEKFLEEYKEKILFRDRLGAHDWCVANQVMNDIKLFLNNKFRF